MKLTPNIHIGLGKLVLIAGPCVIEGRELCRNIASTLQEICEETGISYIFKASFDKANRTSNQSFRTIGKVESLKVLQSVKSELNIPVTTDVHESQQVTEVAEIVDILQIPAFLCRQTDLLIAAGNSNRAVNIKKGQFMAPEDMSYAVDKVKSTGNNTVVLTERGSSFGYHNLVVDMRSLPKLRRISPVIFDATHSVQQPGSAGGSSGGQREFVPYLARAAAAVGVDGFFIETHPAPDKALSDGPNMIPLDQMEKLIKEIHAVWKLRQELNES